MKDIIIILILIVILGSAIGYIIRAKKSGIKCIGCSMGGSCSKSKSGCCSDHSYDEIQNQKAVQKATMDNLRSYGKKLENECSCGGSCKDCNCNH